MKKDKLNEKDVGFLDDAILYIQNMVAAENHAIMTWAETKEDKWLDIAKTVRRNRSKMLYKLVPKESGELYCFSKHILVCSTALKELANRYTENKEEDLAKECLSEAHLYEQLFKHLIGGKK